MRDLFTPLAPAVADARAREWALSMDPAAKVGSKHHIVPKSYLARFAALGRLSVRDRITGVLSTRRIDDLAVRDFYTFVHVDGHLDGSIEEVLSVIEGAAVDVLRPHIERGSFAKPRPLNADERFQLDTFVAAQYVRGNRARRTIELTADYGTKLVSQAALTPEQIKEFEFVPHQNDHIKWMNEAMEKALESLADRPTAFVSFDAPLLITGDEPVLLARPAYSVKPSVRDLYGYAPTRFEGVDRRDIIQMRSGQGAGLGVTDEVVVPLTPSLALVYGERRQPLPPRMHIAGGDAADAARELNAMVLANSVDWVAAHPEHPTFKTMKMPAPEPILTIFDGGTVMGRQARTSSRRRPRRLTQKSLPEQ